ncbi:hypothetical protein [Thiomicrorhabdus sp. Kp2]|uniref:hypothetical protein n=1 Tax=Thiomicrorhabdus sp. Kp2 TaxID=1123518 RepID=UPI0004188FC3|nr:hypothetical protein [Thiomicrorhabdus sp. Kp2]
MKSIEESLALKKAKEIIERTAHYEGKSIERELFDAAITVAAFIDSGRITFEDDMADFYTHGLVAWGVVAAHRIGIKSESENKTIQ